MYDLSSLKMIAQGGQADIYELDDDKILRVLRDPKQRSFASKECLILQTLRNKGKPVPYVYDFIEIEGKPTIVMEKIRGISMLTQIQKSPLSLFAQTKKLAAMQSEVSQSATDLDLPSIKSRAASLIPLSNLLNANEKRFVLGLLEELPDGNALCHGDFHPGNILVSQDKYVVIDWFGAAKGDKLVDIAHTYLILKNTPKIPGMSNVQFLIIRTAGALMAKNYLSACFDLSPFDWGEFSKWMVVRAAERIFYGHESEKKQLLIFIRGCMEASANKIDSINWWKFLR